ncbi:MAG: surface lipoprotein assembly modifier [Novosphingobium sp.]|nr:DUF560 domain-containing protein [Novosphingobium sp.]
MPPALKRFTAIASVMASLALANSARGEESVPQLAIAEVPAPAISAATPPAASTCVHGKCEFRLSPSQLLAIAERLVVEKKYNEARPFVAALQSAPGLELQYNFLGGMIALETGDPKTATARFRSILKDNPAQTRVRLELARALLMQGKFTAADYHLRLAQDDEDLPDDIARQISNVRSIIRSNRKWRFGFDFGFAPDSNINSATNAETVDVNFGPVRLPVTLNEEARARSGVGMTASMYASLRIPAAEDLAFVFDTDASFVNYEGKDADDHAVQLAAGPELTLDNNTRVTAQGVGLMRWYGGRLVTRQFGSKLTLQHDLSSGQRLGVQLDGRRTESPVNSGYNGWQLGVNATYEQVIAKSAIASGSIYARREFMNEDAYSNTTFGFSAGIGGELPFGINAGLSGGVSYSKYDKPQTVFSFDDRTDWRYQGRVYLGLRQFRLAGFSPSIEYRYSQIDTNYDFYRSERHRVNFKLARYF